MSITWMVLIEFLKVTEVAMNIQSTSYNAFRYSACVMLKVWLSPEESKYTIFRVESLCTLMI